MSFLDFIVTTLFVGFVAFLVIGFNRQMFEKNEQRRQKYEKFKEKSKKMGEF